MPNLKTRLRGANQFLKDYALVLLLALGAGYWLLGNLGNGGNHYYREVANQSYDSYAQEESLEMMADMAAPTASFSRVQTAAGKIMLPPIGNAQGFDPEAADDERKIVKNGSLQLEVESPEESLELVEGELATQKAYITHQNSWEVRRGTLAYNLTIRVPADNLETLSANLEKLGLKKGENYSTADITAQYADTANTIKNKEASRERLRELMARETDNIGELLNIERELTRIQTEIDRLNSTQKQRNTDVAYSTLQLTLNPEPEIGDFSSPDWNLQNSWKQAVNDFIHDARSIVESLIFVVVYTPIWLPIILIGWGLKRLIFGKKKNKK